MKADLIEMHYKTHYKTEFRNLFFGVRNTEKILDDDDAMMFSKFANVCKMRNENE